MDAFSRLGIAGDGQLGRMLTEAAKQLGITVVVYGTSGASPAGQIAPEMIVAPNYQDPTLWSSFAQSVQVVTAEWENVPAPMLRFLAESVPVFPSPRCFEIASDRRREKEFAASLGIPPAPYLNINPGSEMVVVKYILPGILKTCSGGYDGHGQTAITTEAEFEAARAKITTSHVLERRLAFACEISLIGVRSVVGEIALYPVVRNIHEQGILRRTIVGETPAGNADIPEKVRTRAARMMIAILKALDYVGVLAVEMFVLPDGQIIFNEMAPRVHNSGHWTIEGCVTSQFENHVRAVCGLRLGSTKLTCQGAIMHNVLGDEITPYRTGQSHPCGVGQFFHDYGKAEVRPGRKMGHLTTIYK